MDPLPAPAPPQACPRVYRCIVRRRTWNGNTTPPRPSSSTRWLETEMQLAHCSKLYRRGLLQLSVPLSVAACSRTLLLGQSVTRQVERDVVLHRACWQLLPVIPMPGEGLAHRRQPIFDPTAVFWRLQPGLELHSLDSELATIVELGTFFFKLEWRLFAAANPTSSSACVSLTSSSFSFLQPVVACCGAEQA